jgi:hypothetical protein
VLAGIEVSVTCTLSTHVEDGTSFSVYEISSRAERGSFGERDYVSRSRTLALTTSP